MEKTSNWFSKLWNYITGKNSKKATPPKHHYVAPKQVIKHTSPSHSEQERFIDEGGNSQPIE